MKNRVRKTKKCLDCGEMKSPKGIYCKKCVVNFRASRPSGLKYVLKKLNPTSFKKGKIPWNKGLPEEFHPRWKGDSVGYDGVHSWVEKHLGKERKCQFCKTTEAKLYHWSNKSGKYKRDLNDWQRLCVRCHFYYDLNTFGIRNEFHR